MEIELPPKKRNQHHVWQHYLRSWTLDGAICCMSGGRIFTTGTPIVAMERDFYKLHDVTAQDIAIIRWLASEKTHPLSRKLHTISFWRELPHRSFCWGILQKKMRWSRRRWTLS